MNRLPAYVSVLLTLIFSVASADSAVRFTSVDVYLDSREGVAAWQFEFAAPGGAMQVVGVENGESEAFGDAPYYDREAVAQGRADRIVVADYSLADTSHLPSGRIRVTTLHLMLTGDATPDFDTRLVVATTHDGRRIDARISLEVTAGSEK